LWLAVGVSPAHAAGWAVGGNGLVIRSDDAGRNWSSSHPTTTTLNALHFVDDTEGWAVGNNGIAIHTTSGGDTWEQTSPGIQNLNAVYFTDAAHGWIVGDGGKVLRTTNGGSSWTTGAPTGAALYDVHFVNANTGWAVGKGVVLRTTNGGASWIAAAPSTATLQGVFFVSPTVGWVVGSNGVVLATSNGGVSWTQSAPTTSNLNAVHFATATLGWAVGGSGSVIRTTDGGASWSEQRPTPAELRSVFFIDDRVGWAVGGGGAVLETADGGDTWSVTSPAAVTLNGVYFASVPTGVTVTVDTAPAGRSFSVDGVAYTGAQVFLWNPGDPHTLATTSPQDGAPGTRYLWSSWSQGGAMSQAVAPQADAHYTAVFAAQHALTMVAGANGTVTPPDGWYNAGAGVAIEATPDPGFGFNGWSGTGSGSYTGWGNPALVTMNGPVTETAVFGSSITVVVQCNPAGPEFTVDGTTYSSTQQFTWAPGSSHTLDAATPQNTGTDTRYVFTRWSDSGGASHTIAPMSNTTYSATFKTQYTLTMQAGAGGTVSPADGWQDAGTLVMITASPDSGYSFQSWSGTGSGSYTGSANPRTISVNGPISQLASFVLGTTPAAPAALTLLTNAPNPFTTDTEVRFGLPADSDVRVDVFDVTGRRVFSDVVRDVPRGWQSYRLDASGSAGRLASGVYFVRVTAAQAVRTARITLLR
jgi:photosystem II stability/assembly factor-like uncharacterized protein